ncbi:hypothetical protein GW17_00001821 [Ensete ventricosum]|nr:hypothetical protein GW17_00001821 [Ensete ventricosum]
MVRPPWCRGGRPSSGLVRYGLRGRCPGVLAGSSTPHLGEASGLHFVIVLIDRVHDAGRLIQSLHEKILALKAANKELKASVNQELAATAEQRVKELETKIKRMQAELESHRIQQRELKKEVGFLRSTELKVEGHKVVAAYKATRGFESGLEKMGRVNYKFGYRVTLEQLREKHSDIMIELDPFAECFEDANVEMDLDQPFYDDTPSEKQPTL